MSKTKNENKDTAYKDSNVKLKADMDTIKNSIKYEYVIYLRSRVSQYTTIQTKHKNIKTWDTLALFCHENKIKPKEFFVKADRLLPKNGFITPYMLTQSKVLTYVKTNIEATKDTNIPLSIKDHIEFNFNFLETLYNSLHNGSENLNITRLGGDLFVLRSPFYKLPAWIRMCLGHHDDIVRERYKESATKEIKEKEGLYEALQERKCDLSWLWEK